MGLEKFGFDEVGKSLSLLSGTNFLYTGDELLPASLL